MKLYEKIYNDIKLKINAREFDGRSLLPTEAELQKKYGVSRITVKHAYEKLAAENLVTRIAGKGTVINENRNISSNKIIGLVLCDFNSSFGMNLIKSMEKEAERLGYSIIIKISKDNHETESRVLAQLKSLNVSGIIIQNCHGEFTKNLIELSINNFPLVSVDRYAKGLLIPSVTSDNFNACMNVTEYLLNRGHRKILLASVNPQNTSSLTERIEGFKQAHINYDAALSYDNFVLNLKSPITKDDNDIRADVESIKGILDKSEITAIVATEQYVSELCSTAVSEMGKAFPENYELICFDYEGDSLAESKYTYVLQNEEEMGIAAIRQLISQIDDQSAAMRTVIKSKLIFGNSTKNEINAESE